MDELYSDFQNDVFMIFFREYVLQTAAPQPELESATHESVAVRELFLLKDVKILQKTLRNMAPCEMLTSFRLPNRLQFMICYCPAADIQK
jgi:hypothetical protein